MYTQLNNRLVGNALTILMTVMSLFLFQMSISLYDQDVQTGYFVLHARGYWIVTRN